MSKSFLAVASLAALPFASQAIVFNTIPDTTANTVVSGSGEGHMFTVGSSPISVSQVGMFDAGGDGLAGTASISFIKAGGGGIGNPLPGSSVVASYSVSGAVSSAGYVYAPTGGLSLQANTLYLVVVTAAPADAISANFGSVPTFSNSLLTYNGDIANGSVGIGSLYKVANFVYAVPEPETYAMVAGVGLVAFGLWRRRQ